MKQTQTQKPKPKPRPRPGGGKLSTVWQAEAFWGSDLSAIGFGDDEVAARRAACAALRIHHPLLAATGVRAVEIADPFTRQEITE